MPRKDKSLCSVCETSLSQDNAYKNKIGYRGLDSRCKPCRIKQGAECNHRPGVKAMKNRLNGAYKTPTKVDLTPLEEAYILAYYDLAVELNLEVDHVIPRTKGGVHAPWNLQVISGADNKRKSNKWPLEVA